MRKTSVVYDNGGITFDRYTVVINPAFIEAKHYIMKFECLALSWNCTSVQGFSQFSECEVGPHLGKKIRLSSLPYPIRRHIQERLVE